MSDVQVLTHPLTGNCFKALRDRDTQAEDFRLAMNKLALLLALEATKDLTFVPGSVITPLDVEASCPHVLESRILLVPILRAGLGFIEGFLEILPSAKVAHIGISRDHETLEAITYLNTVPDQTTDFDQVFVLDPMLATGNSSTKALELIVNKGYRPEQITFVCAVSVQQGINKIKDKFPQIKIITGTIDEKLNEKAYIVPGLGDAGDRLYLF